MTTSKLLLAFLFGLYSSFALSHGNEVHDDKPKEEKKMPTSDHSESLLDEGETEVNRNGLDRAALEEINHVYQKKVRPIFKKACFNCHTSKTKFPWYYKLPFVKGQIDADIKEAKKHLEMGDSFPFGGHGNPYDDLDAIETSIKEGTMPPLKYQIMHWDAFISKEDKKAILQWVKSGKGKLKNEP